MINILKEKDILSIKILLKNKTSIFNIDKVLSDNYIKKLINSSSCIGYSGDTELEAIMILDKNDVYFYLDKFNVYYKLLKYLVWNYSDGNLVIKVNKKDKLRFVIEKYKFQYVKSEKDYLIYCRKNSKIINLFAKD